jgi:hypothetical protein
VEVVCRFWPHTRVKANKGAERSCRSRRSRRGQRRGKKRARVGKTRDPTTSARTDKTVSARRINHSGRKFIWCVRTAHRVFTMNCMQSLEKEARVYFGGRRRLDKRLTGSGLWKHCRNVLSPFCRRAKAMGVPPPAAFEVDLWTFIQVQSPSGGDWDALLDLAWAARPEPPVLAGQPVEGPYGGYVQPRGPEPRLCRVCGGIHGGNDHIVATPRRRGGFSRKTTRGSRGRRV